MGGAVLGRTGMLEVPAGLVCALACVVPKQGKLALRRKRRSAMWQLKG